MNNLQIYNAVRTVPPEALKTITAGRLKGKSDINPMWRLKILTEQFGPCGIGWKYEIVSSRLETGSKEQIAAFVDINLYVKYEGEWSAAIPGTGGSSFVAAESGGLYTNDECFKMALTDALSVSCKALGVAADVYWDKDKTKYTTGGNGTGDDNDTLLKQIIDAGKAKGVDETGITALAMYAFKREIKLLDELKRAERVTLLGKIETAAKESIDAIITKVTAKLEAAAGSE